MTDWKQKIEAQIKEIYDAGYEDEARNFLDLLDVAVAADKCGEGKALLNELWDALDKLREVGDD